MVAVRLCTPPQMLHLANTFVRPLVWSKRPDVVIPLQQESQTNKPIIVGKDNVEVS